MRGELPVAGSGECFSVGGLRGVGPLCGVLSSTSAAGLMAPLAAEIHSNPSRKPSELGLPADIDET